MFGKLWAYWRHAFDPSRFRVVMTLLVRNEADIIEANIRAHAALGVDGFVVMNHLSNDGTREILTSLAGEFDLQVIDQLDPAYKQSRWMTELACFARDRMGADWVICNDADEFWLPCRGESLKELIAFKGVCLTCRRFNMLLQRNALQRGYQFHDSRLRVNNPVFYGNESMVRDEVTVVLSRIAPKVIVNPHGLVKIKGGNHRALHGMNWLDYNRPYDRIEKFEDIRVFHYPMRGFEHFERNVRRRSLLLSDDSHVRMGNHYRRWAEMHRLGRLEEEYGRFLLGDEDLRVLKKFGVVTEDDFPGRTIKKALGEEAVAERKTA
ncbi:MAG: glycosyltransferase family 2 protein [Syntrophotaleaceae bacterium]